MLLACNCSLTCNSLAVVNTVCTLLHAATVKHTNMLYLCCVKRDREQLGSACRCGTSRERLPNREWFDLLIRGWGRRHTERLRSRRAWSPNLVEVKLVEIVAAVLDNTTAYNYETYGWLFDQSITNDCSSTSHSASFG